MKTEHIIKTLQEHNDWRRGKSKWSDSEKAVYFDTIIAGEIGQTIDVAIERLQTLKQEIEQLTKERDEARHIASYWRNMAGTSAILKRKNKFPWEK